MTFLKGVYWDLDGTIANTELEAHLPSFNLAFEDFGLNWYWETSTYIDLLKINGGKNRICYFSQIKNYSITNELVNKIHERKQFHYLNNIKNNAINLKVGVNRLINELHKKKVRQFIVTSSSRIQVEYLVNNLFKDFNPFEFIISSDDVKLHKPDPTPYLKAIESSGLKRINTLVFEDSNQGLKSSLNANLPTIFIPSNIPSFIDKSLELSCILDSLGDENNVAKVIKGPRLNKKYIDFFYLNNYLEIFFHAKN